MANGNGKRPRSYGAPTGVEKPITTGRTAPVAASPRQVGDYLSHMIAADKAFHAQKDQGPVRRQYHAPQGSEMLARGKPPVGQGGRAREMAIDRKVREAGG